MEWCQHACFTDHFPQLLRRNRLVAIAERGQGIWMHLKHQTIGPGGDRGTRHRWHQVSSTCGMAGINDHRQVSQLVQERHTGQIQNIARLAVKAPDAPLAEDNLRVASNHSSIVEARPRLSSTGLRCRPHACRSG